MKDFSVTSPQCLSGEAFLPGDKSISHRAVMIASISDGSVEVNHFLRSDDCLRTVECMRSLGIDVKEEEDRLIVKGKGLNGLKRPKDILYVGNSGTSIRLLLGILAGQGFRSTITGDESIKRRPMTRVVKPLSLMGAKLKGRGKENLAPVTVEGTKLKPIEYTLPVASAQVKSAILLAGLFAAGKSVVIEKTKTRDHTERMLEHFGARIEIHGDRIILHGSHALSAPSIDVPADISAAAYLMVAATLVPGSDVLLKSVGMNPGRVGIIDVLHRMGANIEVSSERIMSAEPVADIRIKSARLKGVEISGGVIPRIIDEIPIIALAATQAEGETAIRDAQELRVKESDRITTTSKELARLGGSVKELRDGMVVKGRRPLKGAECQSYGDHRIAMMCAVAGLLVKGKTVVKKVDCVDTSFPGFADTVNSLASSKCVEII